MKLVRIGALVTLLAAGMAATILAQDADKGSVVTMAGSKFMTPDGVPPCASLSPAHGDPSKGASTFLMKATAGCVVPWHWHTANENLMIVSGKGKLEMKGEAAHTVSTGDYVYLPSKHVHEFTCIAACTFFNSTDGAFDLHYVDKDGKEIAPADALKSKAKAKPASAPKK